MWQYNYSGEYLCHWGIKGMQWGVRRYQNSDGTLTPAGKKRYASEKSKEYDRVSRTAYKKYSQLGIEKREELTPKLTSEDKKVLTYGAKKNIERTTTKGLIFGGPVGGALANIGSRTVADYILKDLGSSSKEALSIKSGRKTVNDILKLEGDLKVAKSTIDKIEKKDNGWVYIPR